MKLTVETDINTFLREERKRLKIKQEDLAKVLGLSGMGLSHLEKGSRCIKLDLLEKWANELGFKVNLKLERIFK
jgi:transcriptional regulator with XRE-family HTH domain